MAITRERWWQPPRLHNEGERRVSWLELFFDLVFVVVISELAHLLVAHPDLETAVGFVLLFVPVWWVWIGATIYNDRFETGDISYRLITLAYMMPVAALAVFVHDAFGQTSIPFALAYLASRLMLIGLWFRAGYHVPEFRPVSNRYIAGFAVSVVLWTISIFVPPPLRFVLWGIGLAFDILTPIWTIRHQMKLPRLTFSKLAERFGLFTIVVLGESVVGVVRGMAAEEPFTFFTGLDGALGLVLAFCVWWVYFDFVGRRLAKPNPWWGMVWNYLHLPLLMAITATGAGILLLVQLGNDPIPDPFRRLICFAIAIVLFSIGTIELTLRRDSDEPTDTAISVGLKLAAGAIAILVGIVGAPLTAAPLLVLLILLFGVQMAYGGYVWFHRPIAEPVLILEEAD